MVRATDMHLHGEAHQRLAQVLYATQYPSELHPQRMSQMLPYTLLRGAFEPIDCTWEGFLQSHQSSLIVHHLLDRLEEEGATSTEAIDQLEHHEVQYLHARPMLFEQLKHLLNQREHLPLLLIR